MSAPDLPVVETRVARAGWDEHSYFGWRVFAELGGHESVASLLALTATGRRMPPADAAMLDDIATVWTIADPRIWPLKLTRLAASYGGVVQGLAAGYLSLDNPFIGVLHVTEGAANFLLELRQALADRDDEVALQAALDAALARTPRPPGYGVPLREQDERVIALRQRVVARGRAGGAWWQLFERVWPIVLRDRRLPPNIGAAYAALCLDLGLSPREMSALALGMSFHGFLAHALEGAAQRQPVLQQLPSACVRYAGRPRRASPRALAGGAVVPLPAGSSGRGT